jgi:hypothetical protein
MAGKPGRPSLASQAVSTISKLDVLQRPDAPYDLTDEHAMEEGRRF